MLEEIKKAREQSATPKTKKLHPQQWEAVSLARANYKEGRHLASQSERAQKRFTEKQKDLVEAYTAFLRREIPKNDEGLKIFCFCQFRFLFGFFPISVPSHFGGMKDQISKAWIFFLVNALYNDGSLLAKRDEAAKEWGHGEGSGAPSLEQVATFAYCFVYYYLLLS